YYLTSLRALRRLSTLFFYSYADHRDLHSFPTRRSSDLPDIGLFEVNEAAEVVTSAADVNANVIFGAVIDEAMGEDVRVTVIATGDRKSTRLNSSHVSISYAVFCLKKKTRTAIARFNVDI